MGTKEMMRMKQGQKGADPSEELPKDYFCLNYHMNKLKKKIDPRCFEYSDMKARKRAENMAVTLIGDYPELGDLDDSRFRWLSPTLLAELAGIEDETEKGKAIELLVEALKTRKSPITGKSYGATTIKMDEWHEIRRLARGQEPTGRVQRAMFIYPSDVPMLKKILDPALADARRVEEDESVVSRLEYFRDRLTKIKLEEVVTQRDGFVDAVEPSTSDAAAKKTMPRADDTTQPIRSQSWGPKDLILMCLPSKEEAEAIASDPHLKVGAWGTSKWVQDENGLSQATVSKCLNDLMEEGSVVSIRTHQATRTGTSQTWIYYRVYE